METLVGEFKRRNEEAKSHRSRLLAGWQKVTRYVLPYSGRYYQAERDKSVAFAPILDNQAAWAHDVLVAGISAGAFPQSMPWVGLRLKGSKTEDGGIGAEYCDRVADVIHATYSQANVYPGLRHCVSEMSAYGPGCLIVEEHEENIIHLHRLTAGEFCFERDFDGYVSALFREFVSTVGAVVDQFGYDACRQDVQIAWDEKKYGQEVRLLHVIDERKRRDPSVEDNQNMPWRSVYIDLAGSDTDPPLRESGYPFMPVLGPRWQVIGSDTYGTSAVLRAMGDISGLQHKHTRLGEAVDRMTRPATQGPADVEEVQTLPGSHTRTNGGARIEPIGISVLPIQHLKELIEDDRMRIARALYADVFQAFLGDQRSGVTAREIMARTQEKVQGMAPVLNNIDHELLRPLVKMTIWFLAQRGMMPPAPPELEGEEMDIEFVSPLFRAMKSEQSRGTMQLLEMIAQLGTVPGWDHVRDRADVDAAADELRDTFGAPARVLKTVREVQSVRDARAKAIAAQQQMQAAQSMAGTAKDLAGAELSPTNALGQLGGAR